MNTGLLSWAATEWRLPYQAPPASCHIAVSRPGARVSGCQQSSLHHRGRKFNFSERTVVRAPRSSDVRGGCAPRLVRTVVCPAPGGASYVAFSHDGRMLACAGPTGTVGVISLDASPPMKVSDTFSVNADRVYSLAFSPRKWLLACGGQAGVVRLWNRHSREELRPLAGHRDVILALAFSPDGRLLASGSLDDTVTLWEPEASVRRRRRALRAEDSVWAVAFSPDGRMLATSAIFDGTVRLWDPATGALLRTLTGNGRAGKAAFSPTGWRAGGPTGWLLASASGDVAQLWYLAPPNGLWVQRLALAFQPGPCRSRHLIAEISRTWPARQARSGV